MNDTTLRLGDIVKFTRQPTNKEISLCSESNLYTRVDIKREHIITCSKEKQAFLNVGVFLPKRDENDTDCYPGYTVYKTKGLLKKIGHIIDARLFRPEYQRHVLESSMSNFASYFNTQAKPVYTYTCIKECRQNMPTIIDTPIESIINTTKEWFLDHGYCSCSACGKYLFTNRLQSFDASSLNAHKIYVCFCYGNTTGQKDFYIYKYYIRCPECKSFILLVRLNGTTITLQAGSSLEKFKLAGEENE